MDVADCQQIEAQSGSVRLAGSWWKPAGPAIATLLMHPGSGPSTRDNDVYFPEIRAHLLTAGIAVASFDKRGIGGSSGRWQDAGISEQADDVIAGLDLLVGLGATSPIGLFGHSQGGWVVLDAARRDAPAGFIVVNSGPGVSPAIQDRFSMGNAARTDGLTPDSVEALLGAFDFVADLLRGEATFTEAQTRLAELDADAGLVALSFIAGDEAEWQLARRILDHDPRPAMRRIAVPTLVLFGADDEVVPVDASVDAFLEEMRPDLLTIAVLAGGNHRIQTGEPPRLADDYADTLIRFITSLRA